MTHALAHGLGKHPKPEIGDYDRVYIHVGLHRTGTTYIQRVVAPLLDADKLVKPRVGHLLSGRFEPSVLRRRLSATLSEKRHPALLISQETLSGRPENNPPDWPDSAVRQLHAAIPEGRIILVLRNQWNYLESLYAYRVMSRGLEYRSFTGYLEGNLRKSLLRTLAYDELVDAYRSYFGSGNVLILLQEQLQSDPKDFLTRLSAFMGVDVPEVPESRRLNATTRSAIVLKLNRALNLPGRGASSIVGFLAGPRASRSVLRSYSRIKERCAAPLTRSVVRRNRDGLVVDPAVKDQIDRAIGTSNRRLQALLADDLTAHGYVVS